MGRYSWQATSESSDYSGNQVQSVYSETDELIALDQAELEVKYPEPHDNSMQYPPQPEVEFGFPRLCYCGDAPILTTSKNQPWRKLYTCKNVDDGECHVWKYWDVAVMEEMRARENRILQLEEKVDSLNLLSDCETEGKLVRLQHLVSDLAKSDLATDEKVDRLEYLLSDLSKKAFSFKFKFEVCVGVILFLLVVLGLVIAMK